MQSNLAKSMQHLYHSLIITARCKEWYDVLQLHQQLHQSYLRSILQRANDVFMSWMGKSEFSFRRSRSRNVFLAKVFNQSIICEFRAPRYANFPLLRYVNAAIYHTNLIWETLLTNKIAPAFHESGLQQYFLIDFIIGLVSSNMPLQSIAQLNI